MCYATCRNDEIIHVNYVPLSETNVSDRPCLLNSHLRMVIVEWVSVLFIGKISGHLEWASTTTRQLRPLIQPAKSMCIWDHACFGYVQCESTIREEFFCGSLQRIQLLTVFFNVKVHIRPVHYTSSCGFHLVDTRMSWV